MIRYLLKGILRDRHRSFFPILVVAMGVALTVVLHCWITGVLGSVIDNTANFATGHCKIMTRAYAENSDQLPNDLALIGVDSVMDYLEANFQDLSWVKRIRFGGLIDVPDKNGETRAQGPAMGFAVDLLSGGNSEIKRLNIPKALVRGSLPSQPGSILISDPFAAKLKVEPGDTITLISSTMYGSMSIYNFRIAGTIQFGIQALDRGAVIMDLKDAQQALNMSDASGEILGYFHNNIYQNNRAEEISRKFNSKFTDSADEFSPEMFPLREQNNLAGLLDYISGMLALMIFVFISAMSIVLWNTSLIGGLRRYGEIGVRLAIGEEKNHVYGSLLVESVIVGLFGSIIGTGIGLGIAYILQTKGIDISGYLKNATMMLPSVFRAKITMPAYYIGFVPGLFSTFLGSALAGIGIFKRKTANLFRELEG